LEALHNQKLSQLRMAPAGVMPPMGYPNGQPVFFQPGMPGPQPRMMYQQMVPRPRFNNNPGGAPQQGGAQQPQQGGGRGGGFQPGMPNFVVPMGGAGQQRPQQPRGPRNGPRGNKQQGGPGQGGQPQARGFKYTSGNTGQPNGKGPQGRPQAPPNAQARGFKYTSSARNQVPGAVPIPTGQNMPPQQQFPPQLVAGGIQTTPEQLEAHMGHEESKQMIGEQLYSLIARAQPGNAGKITGMLLESLELRDLLGLLQNRDALGAKIQEAVGVLEDVDRRGGAQPEGQTA